MSTKTKHLDGDGKIYTTTVKVVKADYIWKGMKKLQIKDHDLGMTSHIYIADKEEAKAIIKELKKSFKIGR